VVIAPVMPAPEELCSNFTFISSIHSLVGVSLQTTPPRCNVKPMVHLIKLRETQQKKRKELKKYKYHIPWQLQH
jgi:hypothetical protein